MSRWGADARAEARELSRMLLWFKAQLPPHELDEWYIVTRPAPEPLVLEDTDTSCIHMSGLCMPDAVRVGGYGRCTRCGRSFAIPNTGNAIAHGPDSVGRVVESMKEWVRREAVEAGPCWGDVPEPELDCWGATLDVARGLE